VDLAKGTDATGNQEECSFFHALDCNRNGSRITVTMLPNVALQGRTAVRHLLPFMKWILDPMLRQTQAKK